MNQKIIFRKKFADGTAVDFANISLSGKTPLCEFQSALSKLNEGKTGFRLRLKFNDEEFDIVPLTKRVDGRTENLRKRNSERYESLTRREKTILCFLSRGYRQSSIAATLNISVNTYRQHRNHLYQKMEFSSKYDLNIWCEKYLDLFFKSKP